MSCVNYWRRALDLLRKHGAIPGEWEFKTEEKVAAALEDEQFIPNRDMWSSVLNQIIALDKVALLDKYVARFGTEDVEKLNPANGWRIPKSKEMMEKLLEYGTDINARDWNGRTFLHARACRLERQFASCGLSVERRSGPNTTNRCNMGSSIVVCQRTRPRRCRKATASG